MPKVRFEVADGSAREVSVTESEGNGDVMVRVEVDVSMAGPCGMPSRDAAVHALKKILAKFTDDEFRRLHNAAVRGQS